MVGGGKYGRANNGNGFLLTRKFRYLVRREKYLVPYQTLSILITVLHAPSFSETPWRFSVFSVIILVVFVNASAIDQIFIQLKN